MIRVGILGCANIAKRSLAPAFAAHPEFEIKAIASRTQEKAVEFASRYGAKPCSYDELILLKEVDLVYCPLPTGLHYQWVQKCLENGKHVLCEKSLAMDSDEVGDLVRIARERNLFLMENFQFRFHPQNLYVKKLLSDGVIGGVRGLDVKFGFPPFPDGKGNIRYSKILGGGALLDAGAYTIKATTYLFGNDFKVKMATRGRNDGYEVDLDGHLWLESPAGIVSNAAYGFHNHYQCGYEIWGEKGRITTTRAFTAKSDFEAEVKVETSEGVATEKFKADHFALMLDYVGRQIREKRFEEEYEQCLVQSELLTQAQNALELY